jgi:hypothetical protein
MDVMDWTASIMVPNRDMWLDFVNTVLSLRCPRNGGNLLIAQILSVKFISWIVSSLNCITQFKFYLIFAKKLTRQAATKRVYNGYFCLSVIQHSSPFPASRSAVTFRYLEGTDGRTAGRLDGRTDSLIRSLHFLLPPRSTGQDFS